MIDDLVALLSVPVVALSMGGATLMPKWGRRLLYAHLFAMSVLAIVYTVMRRRFDRRLPDPPTDGLDRQCVLGYHEGMRCVHFTPARPARRRVLLFTGMNLSVRSMLRIDVVRPLLADCAIVCVQPRGVGESDASIHLSRSSMMQDALSAFEMLAPYDVPCHIMGYSAGGFMAIQLCAGLQPDMYASLTLVGTMFDCQDMALDMRVACIAMRMQQAPLTPKVSRPVMLVHSKHDQHIRMPEAFRHLHARRALSLPTKIITVEGKHSSYALSAADGRRMTRFLRFTDRL